MDYDEFWKFHNKTNMDKHAISLIENQAERIKELGAEIKRLLEWIDYYGLKEKVNQGGKP